MHSKLNAPVFQSPEGDRSATWLELFFDLVFVVSVAALAFQFEHHYSWETIPLIAMIFLPIWWLWMEFSYYGDLFDDNSTAYQWLMILAMAGVAKFALIIRGFGLEGAEAEFYLTICYIALDLIAWLMYLRAYVIFPKLRWFTRRYLGMIGLAMGISAVSLWFPTPIKYGLWVTAVLVQASASPSIYLSSRKYPVQLSHMPERFGLFSIIVLGEGIVALTVMAQSKTYSLELMLAEVCAFGITVCLWKLYFYEASKETVTAQLQDSGRRSTIMSFIYGYCHYFLYLSIIIISVTMVMILEAELPGHHGEEHGSGVAGQMLHVGAVLYLLAITAIHWAAPESLFTSVLTARLICVVLSAGLFFGHFDLLFELASQLVILSGLILTEYLIYRAKEVLPNEDDMQIDAA